MGERDTDGPTSNGIQALLNPSDDSKCEVNEQGLIYKAVQKHGRYYHAWKAGKCPFPCDRMQRDMYNVLHGIIYRYVLGFRGLRGEWELDQVVAGPLVDITPVNVLDIGCGSGLWALDMWQRFPNAKIVGIDLVEGQDEVWPNITWRVPNSPSATPIDLDDADWGYPPASQSYIRLGHMAGNISNWRSTLQKAFNLLTPGTGYIEITDIDWSFRSTTGSLSPTSPLSTLSRLLDLASTRRSMPLRPSAQTTTLLEALGYDRINHAVHRMPLAPWSQEPDAHTVGATMADVLANWRIFESMGLVLLGEDLGMGDEAVRKLARESTAMVREPGREIFVTL